MRLKVLFLSLLVTGALAQTSSEDDHEDLCADKDQQEDGTLTGHKVQYFCGLLGPYSGDRVPEVANAAMPGSAGDVLEAPGLSSSRRATSEQVRVITRPTNGGGIYT
jgi:hypothetical protein